MLGTVLSYSFLFLFMKKEKYLSSLKKTFLEIEEFPGRKLRNCLLSKTCDLRI